MFGACVLKLRPGVYELHIELDGQAILETSIHENIEAALVQITCELSEEDAPYLTLSYDALTIRTLSYVELRTQAEKVAQEMVELAVCVSRAYKERQI